ncbi:MAG: hypothetical protein HGB34_03350 [Candidatus Moranbacteria bacterium]|nr:hypothetical protein [Candidatus Moranbacteria bacterium]
MGKITADQSQAVMATLVQNVRWSEIDFDECGLQDGVIRNAEEAGRQFTLFLKNQCRAIIGEPKMVHVDRTVPFDPVAFLGKGWSIKEQDERSLKRAEFDLTGIRLESMLEKGENRIDGEQRLGRLKVGKYVRLDAAVFLTLWKNQHLIPEQWKEKVNGNTRFIFFDGTVLRNPNGFRYVLYLYWDDGKWRWNYNWLGDGWGADDLSAVLAS